VSAYIGLIISVGIVAALGGGLLYDGEREGASRGAISVILLLATIAPVAAFVSQLSLKAPTLPDLPAAEDGEYTEVAREAFCDGIRTLLSENYSLSEDCFAVKCEGFDFTSMRAERLTVTLRGAAVRCDPLAVEKFINSYEIGDCHAEIGI
jgi:hypothetical protein